MRIILFLLACMVTDAVSGQGIYNFSVTTNAGNQISLSTFQGKKIVVVILPATQSAEDTAFLSRLDSITLANASQLIMVAVPSIEEGYVADSANTLLNWYKSALDTSIVLSAPLYTHVSSGSQQDSLLSWLTHTDQNTHFDYEITGSGTMFFANEQGELYGIYGPEAKWSNKALNKQLQ